MTYFLQPRTPLEIDMAELVGTSKNNFHNSQKYTEAELELLKAVNLKEVSTMSLLFSVNL